MWPKLVSGKVAEEDDDEEHVFLLREASCDSLSVGLMYGSSNSIDSMVVSPRHAVRFQVVIWYVGPIGTLRSSLIFLAVLMHRRSS